MYYVLCCTEIRLISNFDITFLTYERMEESRESKLREQIPLFDFLTDFNLPAGMPEWNGGMWNSSGMPLKNYSRNNGFRILDGGGITLDHPLPYQLKLDEYTSDDPTLWPPCHEHCSFKQFCGAVLISSKHAITAAHCFWDNISKTFKKKNSVE